MIVLALVGLIATSLISGLFALGTHFINPALSAGVFWISFGFIVLIMEPINRILRRRTLEQEAETFKEASKLGEVASVQQIALECEYCAEINQAKILLNTENKFKCTKCGNENNVHISFATARTSTPFTMEVAPEQTVVDEMKEMEEVPNDEQ